MAPLPTIFGTSLGKTVVQAFFWSGLAAAPLTYWELTIIHSPFAIHY